MSEILREVKQVEIDYTCDACGTGKMRPTGATLMSSPPKHPHKCNSCGAEQTFRGVKYPHLTYRPVYATPAQPFDPHTPYVDSKTVSAVLKQISGVGLTEHEMHCVRTAAWLLE